MCKLVVMTVAAAAALAPAAALGQDDWTGIIGSGRPGDPNWAAEAPDRLSPGVPERISPPAPFARPLSGERRPKHRRLRDDRLHRGARRSLAQWA